MKITRQRLVILLCALLVLCLGAAGAAALSNRALKPAEVASDRLSGLDKARLAEAEAAQPFNVK